MEYCAYLVNSTPKYYYMLPLHFTLVKRYASWLQMPMFLATEQPDHAVCQQVKEMGVTLIPLKPSEAGFLDSRTAAIRALALTGRFKFVMPMQEDFLLEREADPQAIADAIEFLTRSDVASVRLMPCPGPGGPDVNHEWAEITAATDTYGFSFQATMWRMDACLLFYKGVCAKLEAEWPLTSTSPDQRKQIEIRANFAENAAGQRFFWEFFARRNEKHVGWKRAGPWPNAVYLSPWPYRPTAIVQGRLEPWAEDMARREGVPLLPNGQKEVGGLQDVGRGY